MGKKHSRFKFHFIKTSSSWLNLAERFFGETTNKMIRRGVPHLIRSIDEFLEVHNVNPKIFTWTKDADTIIQKVNRAREILNKLQKLLFG